MRFYWVRPMSTPKENRKYFGDGGDGIHMMFNFFVNQHLFYALATADVRPLIQAIRATRNIPPTAQWAQFLRNHDELDLGRLTEEQREKVFARFGPEEPCSSIIEGSDAAWPRCSAIASFIELAYSVMFSLPGTPVIRYGDELGMGDDLKLKEREAYAPRCSGPMSGTGDSPMRRQPCIRSSTRASGTTGM
jgi:maltose alpha-D-glucosyltransferase / alpha-amylase